MGGATDFYLLGLVRGVLFTSVAVEFVVFTWINKARLENVASQFQVAYANCKHLWLFKHTHTHTLKNNSFL